MAKTLQLLDECKKKPLDPLMSLLDSCLSDNPANRPTAKQLSDQWNQLEIFQQIQDLGPQEDQYNEEGDEVQYEGLAQGDEFEDDEGLAEGDMLEFDGINVIEEKAHESKEASARDNEFEYDKGLADEYELDLDGVNIIQEKERDSKEASVRDDQIVENKNLVETPFVLTEGILVTFCFTF